MIAAKQDPAVDLRMQRLDSSPQHFRPAGQLGDVADFQSCLTQEFGRASRRHDLHSGPPQRLRELHNAGLVVYADHSPLYAH